MRSIERYLLRWMLSALGLGALVVVLVAYLVTLEEMNEVYDADLRHVAEALGSTLDAVGLATFEARRSLPARTDVPEPEEIVTVLWTPTGQPIYSSDPRVAVPFLGREALTQLHLGGEAWFIYTHVTPHGVAQAAQRVYARQETATEAVATILPVTVGVLLVVTVLLVLALRRGLRPLDAAARDIAARTARTLSPMQMSEVPGELTPLVVAINGLMDRLSQALTTQQRFLGDAAHELRTPVTALRLQLQLLQRSVDAAATQQAMQELEGGIERSQQLIEKLLQVARSDPDAETRVQEPVDLGELVREQVAALSRRAERCGIDLGAQAIPGVVVFGDPHDLAVLLSNLIENALRYTPAGGTVDVDACRLEGRPALRVIDDGPGIAEHERERVFDRFYRGAAAQVQAREPGGSGLGLAIVRGIAERHGALVSLHTPAGGRGLEVRVVFAAPAA